MHASISAGCDNGVQGGAFSVYEVVITCPEGQEVVAIGQLAECGVPDVPPDGEECNEITDAWSRGEIAFVPDGSSQIESFCTDLYSFDDEECQNIAGYIDGHEICYDDKLECEDGGGTYGAWGPGDSIANTICIPPEYEDELPTCDSNGVIKLVTTPDGGGGFVCESPVQPPKGPEIPDGCDPSAGDSCDEEPDDGGDGGGGGGGGGDGGGGDGDGDGDGDGEGEGDGEGASVSGGGSCSVQPRCSGDPVGCAVLWQTWNTRCALERQDQEWDEDPFDPNEFSGDSLLDTYDTDIIDSIESQEGELQPLGAPVSDQVNSTFGALVGLLPPGGSCADLTWGITGKGTMTITCTKLAPLRDILGWVFSIIGILYIVNLISVRKT